MERQVKERLVGAAVLMAAAIILIPEMLSGPDRARGAKQDNEAAINFGPGAARDTPIKTYTIDLTKRPGAQVAGDGEADRTPSPQGEARAPLPGAEAAGEGQAMPLRAAETKAEAARTAADDGPAERSQPDASGRQREAPPAPSTVEAAKPAASTSPASKPLASSPAAPISQGWAVQLGSFSKRSTAEGMVKQLRAKGHEAFVMPVRSGSATLYRVRVGPMKDRAGAEAAQRQLKSLVPAATVVAHP